MAQQASLMAKELFGEGDSFSESESLEPSEEAAHYLYGAHRQQPVSLITSADLCRSLDRAAEAYGTKNNANYDMLRSSRGPLSTGDAAQDEIEELLATLEGATVPYNPDDNASKRVRVPINVRRHKTNRPILVLEFVLDPPYPHACPIIRVVTKEDWVDNTSYLLDWLRVQSESKLGSPMISQLVKLSSMWVEIQLEDYEEQERQRRVREQRALESLNLRKANHALSLAEELLMDMVLPDSLDDDTSSLSYEESSSDSGERRKIQRLEKFHPRVGNIPTLRNLCIRCFADNLLLFEGFEVVPMIIRSKVFNYLISSNSLSHKKLALLIGADQERMDLSQAASYLTNDYTEVLQKAPKLRSLSLRGATKLTDVALSHIANCHYLSFLDVSNMGVTDKGLRDIVEGCPALASVCLDGCAVNEAVSDLVKRCNKLTFLSMNYCHKMDQATVLNVLRYGKLLHTFRAADCGKNAGIRVRQRLPSGTGRFYWYGREPRYVTEVKLSASMREITTPINVVDLDVRYNHWFSDSFVQTYLLGAFSRLRIFLVDGSALTPVGHVYVLSKCQNLRSLELRDSYALSPALFRSIFAQSRNTLASVTLYGSTDQRDANGKPRENVMGVKSIGVLAQQCSNVTFLSLNQLQIKADRVIEALAQFPRLKSITLQGLQVRDWTDAVEQEPPLARSVCVETLRIWGLPELTNAWMERYLAAFPNVREISFRTKSLCTAKALEAMLRIPTLEKVALSMNTGVKHPLSVILDRQHAAKLREVSLFDYRLDALFTLHTMDTVLDEKRVPNTHITTLDLSSPYDVYFPQTAEQSAAVVFQAIFWLMPQLEVLDLTHVLYNIYGVIELPNNDTLRKLRYCSHDRASIVNAPVSCTVQRHQCKKWQRDIATYPSAYNEFSSSTDYDWEIADLFN